AHRLEQAMVAGHRWGAAEFEARLVRHPLMINLVRLVLWGAYDERNRLCRAFRVTEDGTCADVEDAPCTLGPGARVGVVHPVHLTAEERPAWAGVFADYEIIAPFPQLGRRIHTLEPGEEQARAVTRFSGPKIPGMILTGILKTLGWADGR